VLLHCLQFSSFFFSCRFYHLVSIRYIIVADNDCVFQFRRNLPFINLIFSSPKTTCHRMLSAHFSVISIVSNMVIPSDVSEYCAMSSCWRIDL
jgi:hypothetical protein